MEDLEETAVNKFAAKIMEDLDKKIEDLTKEAKGLEEDNRHAQETVKALSSRLTSAKEREQESFSMMSAMHSKIREMQIVKNIAANIFAGKKPIES